MERFDKGRREFAALIGADADVAQAELRRRSPYLFDAMIEGAFGGALARPEGREPVAGPLRARADPAWQRGRLGRRLARLQRSRCTEPVVGLHFSGARPRRRA
ncbi:hypothetical protein [Nocardia sp. NPDC059239]|uniref:hypothetical protein n=1 Tax=Nocardia sp. NPDC059239 TaxID=3346785 RepID=UPI0036B6AE6E